MNNKNLRYLLIFFISSFSAITCQYKSDAPRTIFALDPLTMKCHHPTLLQAYVPYLQSAALPLSVCFFYAINENNVHADITKNPYTTALLVYIALQYSLHAVKQHQQKAVETEMKDMLQQVSHLLIIGHGIRNSIMHLSKTEKKSSSSIDVNMTELDSFLCKTHDLWVSLFLKYKVDCNHQPITIYRSDEIDFFEILQASSHDPAFMNIIVNYYQRISYTYDYQTILEYLENKFITLNDQFMRIKMRIG